MSRQHAIDVNSNDQHISIFGGKLTDCINVGNEIAEIVSTLGVTLPDSDKVWFGEPDAADKEDFFKQAEAMDLDKNTAPTASEPLSNRLWRRYDRRAFDVLEMIKSDPDNAKILIENTEYIRGEVELVAQREMVTKLEDFLRRRSKIEQVITQDNVVQAQGLEEACRILFADKANEKLAEYIQSKNNA